MASGVRGPRASYPVSRAILRPQGKVPAQQRKQSKKYQALVSTPSEYNLLLLWTAYAGATIGWKKYGKPYYRCLVCGSYRRAIPLWEEIKAGIKRRLLDPERLIPAIKAQIDNGKSISGLEEEIKTNQTRLNALEQASQKALRVHLYTPNYPIEKLEAEQQHIEENRKELRREQERLKRQIDELKQAMADEEGLRRFGEIASRNLDSLNDGQWRILLETMKVKILVNDSGIKVKMAVPFTKEESSVIADGTSRCLRK